MASGSMMLTLAMADERLGVSPLACLRPDAEVIERRQAAQTWLTAGLAVAALSFLVLRRYAFAVYSEEGSKLTGVQLPCPLWEAVRVAAGFALLAVLAPVTIYSWALALPLTIVCVPTLVLVRPINLRRRPLRSLLLLAFLAGNAFLLLSPDLRSSLLGGLPRLLAENLLYFYQKTVVPTVPAEAQKYLPWQLVQWLQQGQRLCRGHLAGPLRGRPRLQVRGGHALSDLLLCLLAFPDADPSHRRGAPCATGGG